MEYLHEVTRQIGTLKDPVDDDRTHPSRINQISQERTDSNNNKNKNKWDHENWVTLDVASIESEMPSVHTQINSTPRDKKPVLYGRIKGSRGKIYIDQGAETSVISTAFADANGINRTVLHPPVKLQMANGIIEPALHRVHDVGVGWNQFQSKFSAYIAPLKNYDAILGRDTLRKWQTKIQLSDNTEQQHLNSCDHTHYKNEEEGIEVYDPKTKLKE